MDLLILKNDLAILVLFMRMSWRTNTWKTHTRGGFTLCIFKGNTVVFWDWKVKGKNHFKYKEQKNKALMEQKKIFMDFQEREDYNNKLHVVKFFQFLKKTLYCALQTTLIVSFSWKLRRSEFKMHKNINTRTVNKNVRNNSAIPRRKRGWNTVLIPWLER